MSENLVEKKMPEFTDHWLWFVDEELVDRLMAPDEIAADASIRPAQTAAAGVALGLQMQGRTREAADEIKRALASGEPAGDLYEMAGHLHFQLGEFENAAQYFGDAVRLFPDHPSAGFNLGVCYERLGRYEEGTQAFTTSASNSQLWQAHAGLGYCQLRLERYGEALKAFQQAAELQPGSETALFGMAVAYQFLGRLEEAEEVYVRLLPEQSGNPEMIANLVALAAARKDVEALRDRSERLMQLAPDSRIALEGLLKAAFSAQDHQLAIEYATKITELAPQDGRGWHNLGVAKQKAGLPVEASTCYREVLRIDPGSARAHANLGTVLQEQGDLAAAKASYEEALTLRPAPGRMWNVALVCEQLGEFEEAELVYTQMIEIDPGWADAWFRLAIVRFDRGEFDSALEAFDAAVSAQPDWPEALINAGVCRYKLGQHEEARIAFERALAINPGNLYALTGAVMTAVNLDDGAGAFERYKEIRMVGESLPELAFNVGLVLQRSGDDAGAAECYREAIAKRPDFPEALVNLGYALEGTGESEQAREYWARAVEIAPELAAIHFA